MGIGLTPTGDDFITGLLASFFCITATSLEFPTAGCASQGTNECGQLCGNP
ncbi:oxamate carbamoyltransferase subunit AllH family protein [Enterococcus faecalis]|uniref:oxamate carbamoyltransferase subunit AllH family protein n=1 Tax=Enterococcus faecalis TaxID=1351 RepID=UPI001F2CE838|nr:DUF2877 domain-containing protein [Enterococcus faecalis]